MPKLSEPMRAALHKASEHAWLWRVSAGKWSHVGVAYTRTLIGERDSRPVWATADATVRGLLDRGLLRSDGDRVIITPAGREAIGMKEGGDV